MHELAIDPEIRGLLKVGLVEAAPVRVGPAPPALTAEIGALCARMSAEHAGRQPAQIEGLAAARRLYRAFGIDPTSTRPSSEALLRRILQGKSFPSINSAVDVCNLCSTTFLLPIGLYDASKIRGGVTLRRGRPGESYPGIRKDAVNVAGRPVLVDQDGPFGNPTSDSLRTAVDEATVSLWMVIFAPSDHQQVVVDSDVAFAREAIERHLRRATAGPAEA